MEAGQQAHEGLLRFSPQWPPCRHARSRGKSVARFARKFPQPSPSRLGKTKHLDRDWREPDIDQAVRGCHFPARKSLRNHQKRVLPQAPADASGEARVPRLRGRPPPPRNPRRDSGNKVRRRVRHSSDLRTHDSRGGGCHGRPPTLGDRCGHCKRCPS